MRGGGAGEGGRPEEEDGSVDGGPGCMPIGRGRSGGGVRLRPVSGMRGEGGGVVPRGAGASEALVFFCSTLLRCDLLAKKVPGRAPYSQHIMIRNWT